MISDQGYTSWADTRLRNLVKSLGILMAIVVVSGKTMEFVVDNYLMKDSHVGLADLSKAGDKNTRLAALKGEERLASSV